MRVPEHKDDVAAAQALSQCSADELAPHLGELLAWLKDYNWPVAKVIAPHLSRADARIVPHIEKALRGADDVWKFWILSELVPHLEKSVRDPLMGVIAEKVNAPTPGERQEDVHLVAGDIVALYSSEP